MEIPISSTCLFCRSTVDLHDLRQCTCGKAGEAPHYCFRNCRFCRTEDFDSVECSNRSGHITCFARHLPVEENPNEPHKPLNLLQKLYVDAVTYSEKNSTRQARLHEIDHIAQWFTIKTFPPGTAPRLNVTDRFRQLCDPGVLPNHFSSRQFPGFVSFIGDTGTGKSTLLRAMILMGHLKLDGDSVLGDESTLGHKVARLRSVLAQTEYGPVSKSGSTEHMTDPTSFGVHLYKDLVGSSNSETAGSYRMRDTPILFADCEGFRAGHTLTNAQRADGSMSTSGLITDLPITAKSYSGEGKDGIDLFFARFLYTISDVVVMIMSSDGEFFTDMQRLAEWAASAIYRSVNHLAQKTLIIVRNKATLNHEQLFRGEGLRENLLESLTRVDSTPLWVGSPRLVKFRDEFNSKQKMDEHRIQDNKSLLKKFFADVRACNIPDTRITPLEATFFQYQDLRKQIVDASQQSQFLRANNWMQHNVPVLSHILNRAFEHFRTSDEPFDFYSAARSDNPNPTSVSDHISNFIRHLHLLEWFPSDMIPSVIATHLATWASATRNFGSVREPNEIFEIDLREDCLNGISYYSKRDQRCGLSISEGEPCIKKRATHFSEHCDERGRSKPGFFDESQGLDPRTLESIYEIFLKHYRKLCTHHDKVFALPQPEVVRQFREEQLQKHQHIWKQIHSNKSCFGCLRAVPDHLLECGHAFCENCVKDNGTQSEYFEHGWVLSDCILCQSSWQDNRHDFRLQPRCAGVRILALDGGGIRGIVEISLLEKLVNEMDLNMLPLMDCFDLIMGTSTGGIIALGLATLSRENSIQELKEKFIKIATKAFERKRGQYTFLNWISTTFLMLRIWDSLYPTKPLKDGLQALFKDRKLFSANPRSVRVAVTSAKDNGADKCLITNYNRPAFGDQELDFEREDEEPKEMKIWEAALATASAPFYFGRFEKQETEKNYVDGALHSNFPVQYALDEMNRIWASPGEGPTKKPSLDILLSVGTGQQTREVVIPVPLRIGGFKAICTTFFNNLDSHRQWLEFKRNHLDGGQLSGKVHRLNARIKGDYVSLDDYASMDRVDQDIQTDFASGIFNEQVDELAAILTASLFFFEPADTYRDQDSATGRSNPSISGTIRCRLARKSPALKRLIDKKIETFWYREIHTKAELMEDRGWQQIPIQSSIRNGVRTQGQWLRLQCVVAPVEPETTQQVIAVTLRGRGPRKFPISGFPVDWHVLRERARPV